MSRKTGQCLCGAVRFTIRNVPLQMEVCHCATRRRWTGGAPYLGVAAAKADILFTDEDNIGSIAPRTGLSVVFARDVDRTCFSPWRDRR